MNEKAYSQVFPECADSVADPLVKAIRVKKEQSRMEIDLSDPRGQLNEGWLLKAKTKIGQAYGMRHVVLTVADSPKHPSAPTRPGRPSGGTGPASAPSKPNTYAASARTPSNRQSMTVSPKKSGQGSKDGGKTLWGKVPSSAEIMPIGELPEEECTVTVEGRVFKVEESRERRGIIDKRWTTIRLCEFYIQDPSGAIRVQITFESKKYPQNLEDSLHKLRKGKELVTVAGSMVAIPRMDREEWVLKAGGLCPAPPKLREDKADQKRVELHLHTQMSEKDAITSVKEAVATAARWGHPAIAITDHGVCHAFPDAMSAAKQHGIKVIYGVEGYLPPEEGSKRRFHIILLCQTQEGLRNLYFLVSESHVKHYKGRPVIPWSLLENHRDGLIIGTACEAGELFRAVVTNKSREEQLAIAKRYDYMEIQPICNNMFMVREGMAADAEALRGFNRQIISIADELGKPVCATGDVHFLNPEDEVYRKVLLANMDSGEDPLPLYLKTTEEMLEEFSYLGEERAFDVVVRQPGLLADSMGDIAPVRSGEYFPKMKGSAEELKQLTYDTAAKLYGDPLPELLSSRIQKELGAIIDKGYDIIYMISQKLVHRSMEDGFLVGSRGSVGSSIVAYLSGITEVNALPPHYRCEHCLYYVFPDEEARNGAACGPDLAERDCPNCGQRLIKDGFDIPFATFLGFNADKKPDIDLNFSSDYQPRAHAYTVELFGEEKVYRAGTISTIAEKTAYGYSRKYSEKNMLTLKDADLLWLANGCEGVKSTTGQHPGGLIIVPEEMDIYDFCPVQYPANKAEQPICTHFDYHAIEENLLKLDLLGHDGPTLLKHLEDMTGVKARDIPLDDKKTMSLFVSTEALGFSGDKVIGNFGSLAIPEFGTKFVRGMLKKTMPTTFDELVRISGLSHGTNVWRGNAEDLVDKGIATLRNIVCARDDITLFLVSKGLPDKESFDISEAVRKGKGLKPEWEADMRQNKVPDWYIESCKKIKYMFPKAHAVAYVMMSVKIAWFKVHHPISFYAAWFSVKSDDFDAIAAVKGAESARKRMVEIENDKQASKTEQDKAVVLEIIYEFIKRGFEWETVDLYRSDTFRFLPTENGLRLPLAVTPGLGAVAAQSIEAERKISPFMSVEDLQARCKVTKAHIEALRTLGTLASLPESAQFSLFDENG